MVGPRVFLERVAAFLVQHHIEPVIDRTFAFDQAAETCKYPGAAGYMRQITIAT